jgi:hypothetical protein
MKKVKTVSGAGGYSYSFLFSCFPDKKTLEIGGGGRI